MLAVPRCETRKPSATPAVSRIAMGTQYTHLELEERCCLRGLMEMGLGIGEIDRRLGRHQATIHREIARNRCVDGYRPDSAERRAWIYRLRNSLKV